MAVFGVPVKLVAGLFIEVGLLVEVHHRYDYKSLTEKLLWRSSNLRCNLHCRNIRPRCWSLKEGVKREMIASKHWRIRRRPWLRKAIWCRYCKTLEWYAFVYHVRVVLLISSAQWLVPTYMYFCFLVWITSCLKIIFWHPLHSGLLRYKALTYPLKIL